MRVVGIKQLKAKLSEYLRDVRRGEVFLVTDRDRVVAELRPASSDVVPPIQDVELALRLLADAGEITPARMPGAGGWRPRGLTMDARAVSDLLDGLRSDRDGHS